MREYSRNDKIVIHSSSIYDYYTLCPKAYILSQEHRIIPTNAMARGLILEGELWGWKDEELKKELLKGKRSTTLDTIKKEVEIVKLYFPDNGEPFKMIEFETPEYILQGEVDYYTDEMLYDLKRVSTHKYWDAKETVLDFLQAYYYPYIIYMSTKKIIPFKYVVYADDIQLVKEYLIPHPEAKFNEIEKMVKDILTDLFFEAQPSENCINGIYGKCRYLQWCKEGQQYLTKPKVIE